MSDSAPNEHAANPDGEGVPWHTNGPKEGGSPKKRGGGTAFVRELAIVVVIVLVLAWIIQTFIGRQYVIPSESMENTLHGCAGCSNDRIVTEKVSYWFGDPKPGDVVVFKAPTESWNEGWTSSRSSNSFVRGVEDVASWFMFAPPDENDLVKRVIATGGQTVECHNADKVGVVVDGKPLKEPYIDKNLQLQDAQLGLQTVDDQGRLLPCLGQDFGPITVAKDHLWVMGDNRGNSSDSRAHSNDELHGMVPVSNVRGRVLMRIYPFSRIGGVGSVNPQK